jgi:ferredoxin-NADP reductase
LNKPKEYKIQLLRRYCLEKEYFCFDFTKPEGFEFIEGQFGVFGILNKEVEGRKLRAFSIASTNEEPFIRVATKINSTPSSYKKIWMELLIGEEVTMNAPLGEFVYENKLDAVFIAGGIGITPLRSMLFSKQRISQSDTLIYSELEGIYPFKDEIMSIPHLTVLYAADIEPTQRVIRESAQKHQNDALYYLSGSPGFVKGITALLKEQGIMEDHIRFDVFLGY